MSQFIESIRIKDRKVSNLNWHKKRVQSTFDQFFPESEVLDLDLVMDKYQVDEAGLFKCRIIYDSINSRVEITPYRKREIKSLVCVQDDEIDYTFKFEDRNKLKSMFENRGDADDILIIKDGYVTDSYYSNVAFLKNKIWYTPEIPLLPGTQRAKLLSEKRLELLKIKPSEINKFECVALFNAMIPFEERIEIKTSVIFNC